MSKLLIIIAFLSAIHATKENENIETPGTEDSVRIGELNLLYDEISRTVREGDFDGYKATYHDNAVVVYTTATKKGSIPIAKALQNWKIDFTETKAGKTRNDVKFQFSQRVGDESTAFDTGIFYFTSIDKDGTYRANAYVNFEMLLVKRNGTWLVMMEYQKSKVTESDWIEMTKQD